MLVEGGNAPVDGYSHASFIDQAFWRPVFCFCIPVLAPYLGSVGTWAWHRALLSALLSSM